MAEQGRDTYTPADMSETAKPVVDTSKATPTPMPKAAAKPAWTSPTKAPLPSNPIDTMRSLLNAVEVEATNIPNCDLLAAFLTQIAVSHAALIELKDYLDNQVTLDE
jgi:hypothetical protein